MPRSAQVIAQPFLRTPERELMPRDLGALELGGLQALVVDAQCAAERGRGVDDDDRGAPGVGVDVDERVEPYVEAAFFARLARRRRRQRFAAIDVAAGKHPLAVAWL